MRFYLFKKVVFNCRKATLLALKKQDGKASVWEQVQLSYHLLYCNACKRFIRQSEQLNILLAHADRHTQKNPSHTLPDAVKKSLQEQIDQNKK